MKLLVSAKFQAQQERLKAAKSGRDFLASSLHMGDSSYQECDPFYIHTSGARLSMRLARPAREGGGARACNLHIVLRAECMCSYELPGV